MARNSHAMMGGSPFLAVPITALVARNGTLLRADPPLWRLHILAGGENDGKLAIAGLANMAAATARTRTPMQRAVRTADEEHDVELWVESRVVGDGVELSVTGWRDLPSTRRDDLREAAVEMQVEPDNAILIDAAARLVKLPAAVTAQSGLGQPVTTVLETCDGPSLSAILTSEAAISDVTVRLIGTDTRYRLELNPLLDGEGRFLGHGGTLIPASANQLAPQEETTPLPMGRQFASVLRQPLSRIVANAETIGSRLRGPLRDNYAEYALDIANAARHLTELVADMEDLEAIDRPDFTVARDPIELGDIAQRVAGLLALKASDHGMVIALPDREQRVAATGEFRRVLQIMLNLVGNAIRYAPDGSTVSITIGESGGMAQIKIADQGSGVPPEDRERIFDKFERLGRSGDGGSGLGLYISRKLARAMEGELSVEDAPGGGALFTLSLPLRRAAV